MSLKECLNLKRLLETHRDLFASARQPGSELTAASTRRATLALANGMMPEILRYVKNSYKFGTPIVSNVEELFSQAVELATMIAQDVKRASHIPEKKLIYRLDVIAASIIRRSDSGE